jgi:hypothetical protein
MLQYIYLTKNLILVKGYKYIKVTVKYFKCITLATNPVFVENVTIQINPIKPGICGVHKCQILTDIMRLPDYTQSWTNVRDVTRDSISIRLLLNEGTTI